MFDGVFGNPTCSQVMAGAAAFKAHRADCVIGFGGGAALDVAKVVGVMAVHDGDVLEYVWDHPQVRPIVNDLPTFVALPTTSGTGSEVGRSSVVSEDDTHVKRVVFSPKILARAVFADPELTLALPAAVTAATGMDALTHNVESYLSPAYHPLCDGIALEGTRIAARALVAAVAEPGNLQARSDMMMASMMGAIAFQKDLGAVHSCAHALGAACDMHHGLANALMIDTVLGMERRGRACEVRRARACLRTRRRRRGLRALAARTEGEDRPRRRPRAARRELDAAAAPRRTRHCRHLPPDQPPAVHRSRFRAPVPRGDVKVQTMANAELITISPIDGSELLRRPYPRPQQCRRCCNAPGRAGRLAAGGHCRARCAADARCRRLRRHEGEGRRGADAPDGPSDPLHAGRGGRLRGARAPHDRDRRRRARRREARARPAGFTRFIRRDPLGVVLVVAPWNYPLLTAVNAVVPALMAGNAVILKPSAQTPLAGERIVEALAGAGLPAGLLQFVRTDHAGTQALIRSPLVDGVCFTGSVAGGAAVEQAAAGRFIHVGLELGGNDPAYVRADAKLDAAVETLVDGAFFNSGQSCCGIQRIYVHRSLYAEFVDKAVALTRQYVLGDPLDPNVTLGPVVRVAAADAVRATVAEAVAKGARTLIDPRDFPLDRPGSAYVAPQILVDVNHGMQVMNDECFGPVVGIMAVDSDDEAVRLMNDSPYGLTACLFTQDESAALALGDRLQTGTVFMNRCDYLDPALAWTGVKNTGRGATLSSVGYEHLTRPKSFHFKSL